jgi:predicted NAD/FAD-dependent oxidoreductase
MAGPVPRNRHFYFGLTASVRLGVAVEPVALKRWRYPRPVHTLEGPVVHRDGAATMVFAGDAFHRDGGRVEGAVLSGLAAAGLALGG